MPPLKFTQITSLHEGQPLEAWLLAKFLCLFRLSLQRKILAKLNAHTSANILFHMELEMRVEILRGINTDEAANIIFWMLPHVEMAAQTLRSPFLGYNKRIDIIEAIARIDQRRAEEIRAPLRRIRSIELLPAALFPQHTIAELRAEFAAQRAEFVAQIAKQQEQIDQQQERIDQQQERIEQQQEQIEQQQERIARQRAEFALEKAILNNRILTLEAKFMEAQFEDQQSSSWFPLHSPSCLRRFGLPCNCHRRGSAPPY